ncbi:hypothetical protein A5gp_00078 [Alteromonas phage vB_AemP_PT15-A5]|nr:hypothetical protein A5gp_00078 [Alteromonas phage vB_AemP_PT15-A5]
MKNINFVRVGLSLLLTALVLVILGNLYSAAQEAPLTYWQVFYSFVALTVLRAITAFRGFKQGIAFEQFRENRKKAAMIEQLMNKLAKEEE